MNELIVLDEIGEEMDIVIEKVNKIKKEIKELEEQIKMEKNISIEGGK